MGEAATANVTVSMSQMVDLALNTPEVGVVNFNILRSLLHVMIQQLDMGNNKVAFRGDAGTKIQKLISEAATPPTSPALNMTEYVVTPGKSEGMLVKRQTTKILVPTNMLSKPQSPTGSTKPVAQQPQGVEAPPQPAPPGTTQDGAPQGATLETAQVISTGATGQTGQVYGQKQAYTVAQTVLTAGQVVQPQVQGMAQVTSTAQAQEMVGTQMMATIIDGQEVLVPITPDTGVIYYGETQADDSLETVVVIDTDKNGHMKTPQVSVALDKSYIQQLEKDLSSIKEKLKELTDLPTNTGLIEALRPPTAEKSSPVLDMFQILSLMKRMDACEAGINKLATMIEDVAREAITLDDDGGHDEQSFADMPSGRSEKLNDMLLRVEKLEQVTDELSSFKSLMDKLEPILNENTVNAITSFIVPTDEHAEGEMSARPSAVAKTESRDAAASTGSGKGISAIPQLAIKELDARLEKFHDNIDKLDQTCNAKIGHIEDHINELEKELGMIVERLNSGFYGGGGGGGISANDLGEASIAELYNKMVTLQADMDTMTETATKLLEDKEERTRISNNLLEEIELLKTIKADKEDLEDALADKADACLVNKKVSHDQFDTACDDLTKGIEEALTKLTQQESMWQQALEDIQMEVGFKLDKVELTPLRDFVNNKLKLLQNRLKALAAMKRDQEAAGTKTKLLRNVNCISCDKDVVMRKEMDVTMMPKPTALPPNRSMGPYLAYELDALRKQQKCFPGSRNMNHFESAMTGAKSGQADDNHICNRYCGGSHTTTTAQQRVTRLGHFVMQFGPGEPMTEGQIRGTDGQMYKARAASLVAPEPERESSTSVEFFPDMKARPSMVVQGDIVAARKGMKGLLAQATDGPPQVAKEGGIEEQPSAEMSQSKKSVGDETRRSSAESRPPGEQQRRSSAEKRPSGERRSSTEKSEKRPSGEKRMSGSRRGSNESKGSRASKASAERRASGSIAKTGSTEGSRRASSSSAKQQRASVSEGGENAPAEVIIEETASEVAKEGGEITQAETPLEEDAQEPPASPPPPEE